MARYELRISVVAAVKVEARVRAWIDDNLEDDLGSETELDLTRVEDGIWSGEFLAPSAKFSGFAYRVGMVAEPGAIWSLCIAQNGASKRLLLEDSDTLSERKQWLLGTCDVTG